MVQVGSEYPAIDLVATGHRIRKLRKERGLSIQQVRDALQISSVQAVYKWERGENLPNIDNLYALSRLFEVPIEQILVQEER